MSLKSRLNRTSKGLGMKSEWKTYKLGEIYEVHNGLSKGRKFFGRGYPFLSFSTVFNHYFLPAHLNDLVESTDKERESLSIRRGDVFVTRTSETYNELGMTSVALRDYPEATYNGFTKRLRPYREHLVIPEFIGYYLRNPHFRRKFEQISNVTTRASLNNGDLLNMEVSIPPLDIQRKIASILSALDDKIETNNAICRNLEEQSQALFSSFYHIESKETPFTDIIQILGGGTPKTGEDDYWNGVIPFFTPKDVQSPYTFNTEKTLSELGLKNCNSKLYPQGTTFVTARGTVGKIAMAGIPMAMNQSCYALVSEKLHPLLVYYYALEVVLSLKQKSSGSVFDAIVTRDFNGESINLLSKKSTSEFLRLSVPIHEKIRDILLENEKIAIMRDAILPKLMKGELDLDKIEL